MWDTSFVGSLSTSLPRGPSKVEPCKTYCLHCDTWDWDISTWPKLVHCMGIGSTLCGHCVQCGHNET